MLKRKIRKLPKPPPDDDEEKKQPKTLEQMPKYELDKEFVRRKIASTIVRTMGNEMDLARIRDTLIEKQLVEKQLSFMLIAMRQKILQIPNTYTRKLMHQEDAKTVRDILTEMCFRILTEIKDLPTKAVDPNWLETLDEEPNNE